jgi:proline dehydrogenase
MVRTLLLAGARMPWLHRWLQSAPASRTIVHRFVAGSDAAAAVDVASGLIGAGLQVSIDHLGEDTNDVARAVNNRDEYVRLLSELSAAGLATGADVSVKLSALGQALAVDGEQTAYGHAVEVCQAAHAVGTTVTLDMEDHTTTSSTLSVLEELRRDFPSVGVAVQASLHRTEADCARLAVAGSRVRLCKGAYAEPESVAYQRRTEVDASFRRCLQVLFAGSAYPMIASHDPRLIEFAQDLAAQSGCGAAEYEFQMLYGVRPVEQRRLTVSGHTVRVYVPYGADSSAYLMRRLAERPANLMFFLRALGTRS